MGSPKLPCFYLLETKLILRNFKTKSSLLMLKGSEVVNRKISKHLLGSVACTQKRENKQLTEQFMTIIWYQKQCFGIFHTMSSVISAVCHNFASWQY